MTTGHKGNDSDFLSELSTQEFERKLEVAIRDAFYAGWDAKARIDKSVNEAFWQWHIQTYAAATNAAQGEEEGGKK